MDFNGCIIMLCLFFQYMFPLNVLLCKLRSKSQTNGHKFIELKFKFPRCLLLQLVLENLFMSISASCFDKKNVIHKHLLVLMICTYSNFFRYKSRILSSNNHRRNFVCDGGDCHHHFLTCNLKFFHTLFLC